MVTSVACHPSQDIVAIGYNDGMVMAVRFADAKEVLLRRPGKGAVSSMMWDDEERRIAFGTESRRLRRHRHSRLSLGKIPCACGAREGFFRRANPSRIFSDSSVMLTAPAISSIA